MTGPFKVACVQVNAQREIDGNVARVAELIHQARAAGADFITMPENVAMMGHRSCDIRGLAMPEAEHSALAEFRKLARETGAWLLPGSPSGGRPTWGSRPTTGGCTIDPT